MDFFTLEIAWAKNNVVGKRCHKSSFAAVKLHAADKVTAGDEAWDWAIILLIACVCNNRLPTFNIVLCVGRPSASGSRALLPMAVLAYISSFYLLFHILLCHIIIYIPIISLFCNN